jgi:hypothetical protein
MNSINYPNYTINVNNVNSVGDTLYLGTNKNVSVGDTNHIVNLNGMLHVNGSSGQSGYVLTNNGITIGWEPISTSGPTGPTGPSGVTGTVGFNGGTLDFGFSKINYGTYTALNNTPTGTIYFNDSFTSTSYSLTLTVLDSNLTDNSVSITQKGTTFADFHMQKGGVGHQINWLAIGH